MVKVDGVTVQKPTCVFSESVGTAVEYALEAKMRHRRRCDGHNLVDTWHQFGVFAKEVFAGPVKDQEGEIVRELAKYHLIPQEIDPFASVPWFYRVVRVQFSNRNYIDVTVFGTLEERDGQKTIDWTDHPWESKPISIFAPVSGQEEQGPQLVYREYGEQWMEPADSGEELEGEWIFRSIGNNQYPYDIRIR